MELARPSAKLFLWKLVHMQFWVHLQVNKLVFYVESFALGLALKQRRKATRKWPIGNKLSEINNRLWYMIYDMKCWYMICDVDIWYMMLIYDIWCWYMICDVLYIDEIDLHFAFYCIIGTREWKFHRTTRPQDAEKRGRFGGFDFFYVTSKLIPSSLEHHWSF